jgi:hypothetical protein
MDVRLRQADPAGQTALGQLAVEQPLSYLGQEVAPQGPEVHFGVPLKHPILIEIGGRRKQSISIINSN